jgi:hypothetical protein
MESVFKWTPEIKALILKAKQTNNDSFFLLLISFFAYTMETA